MLSPQLRLTGIDRKIIVDLFAGGGGMSVAMEMAWGRSPDIAINHNDDALSLHQANHPQTEHYVADVFEVCPRKATAGRPVGWLHLSPDCTHFSQAKGGQPRSSKIRALAWVGIRWAGQVRPDWISLENVKQFTKWGPLIAKRDKETGRVVKLDGSVADPGERVPVQEQFLVPDPKREGQTYRRWRSILINMGYTLDSRNIVAADQGGHTTRERHFEVGNCIGEPIRWNEPTHFKKPAKGQKKWRPAADCIDWSIPCPSIFERKRPLADATLRRIARGIQRYVLESGDPFIVPISDWSRDGTRSAEEPMSTITAWPRGGKHVLVSPTLIQAGYGEREGQAPRALDIHRPLGTVVGSQKHALACAYLMQANGGFNTTPGHDLRRPASTVTNTGSQQQLVTAILAGVGGRAAQIEPRSVADSIQTVTAKADTAVVTAHLAHLRGNCDARDAQEPLRTISAGGEHHGIVECTLSREQTEGAERVAAFMMRYYGEGGQWSDPREPVTTITTKDRMALVTVTIKGTPYVIVDIGLRMLEPRELFRAQDFPDSYIIDRGHDGRKFSKSAQVKMVGNSVNPIAAVGFLSLNAPHLAVQRKVA
ncbi:DNA cytosine methyltransferase [Bordetella hinzii]|uniref:DNA (cytosine-5-)-methyltransferase n=1 Tax=Bordetella hinzii OH87 BAL007II TaxID=1331262 RepID=A0ABR4R5Q6_9BORD|nr:DNA cytosine methyltransferase [Bordetella hinzii]KCB26263.1 C-5 cytosine-specific DNA methylase domain protein [Bordetella hinzii OH87 BAL007II]